MVVLTQSSDHIRKRRIDPPSRNGNNRFRANNASVPKRVPNKFIKFKNAAINWLNGLPPIDYDSALYEFNSDRIENEAGGHNLNNEEEEHNQHQDDEINENNNNNNTFNDKKSFFKKKMKKIQKLLKKSKLKLTKNNTEIFGNECESFTENDFNFINDNDNNSSGFDDRKKRHDNRNVKGLRNDVIDAAEEEEEDLKTRTLNLDEVEIEVRPINYREIFLPPDVVEQRRFLNNNLTTPQMRKKYAESHPWTVSNEIHTAKYTVYNFIPKNLFEQFRRVANVYFLILIILQGIPIFSNTNIFLAASPLVSILVVTAVKDAMEDWKRQKSDNLVNHSTVNLLQRNIDGEEEAGSDVNDTAQSKGSIFKRIRKLLFTPFKGKKGGEEQEILTDSENKWKRVYWKSVRVGDIVMIMNNESIPADMIVLSTSDSQGICYVETKNLDGETNLKIRQAPSKTAWIRTASEAEELNAVFQVEQPSTRLYSFTGNMVLPTELTVNEMNTTVQMAEAVPLSNDNLLLRGCQIRNTEFVIGVIVYTGDHTKIIMNSGKTPSKRSRIEKQMNPQIILSFVLLFVICITCAVMQGQYVGGSISSAPYWYTVYKTGAMGSPIFTGFLTFWSSLILFQTLVPISLYITVECCKLVQAAWIHWDLNLYYPERDQRAVPRSWNIADDLGQIEYIFSDKTGTLTRNVMEFRKCSIGGKVYGHLAESCENYNMMQADMVDTLTQVLPYKYIPPSNLSFTDQTILDDLISGNDEEQAEKIKSFFFAVIVCHTILIDKLSMNEEIIEQYTHDLPISKVAPHLLEYQAQSPDEAALVKSARDLGFVFLGRDHNTLNLSIMGVLERVEILNVIEFNSTRKRMSVIIKRRSSVHGKEEILLVSKGADSVIYERLESVLDESMDVRASTLKDLDSFAESGLRTLCFATRKLSSEEYKDFAERYSEASTSMINREMMMDAVAEEYEKGFKLIGATAIEDRLQDGVPESISTLQAAGVKLWVLTGDKMETAVNIGFSCKLLDKSMFLIMIKSEDMSVESTRRQLHAGFQRLSQDQLNADEEEGNEEERVLVGDNVPTDYALIIDGVSLKHALDDRECRPIFLDLATNCKAVLCCRVSPLQKAKVVELVKKTRNVMTLAIGDGANDVSMIQEADVGIGIAGEEGMQAVMSSDYAIAQFCHLERLLLVHGRLSYVRTAKITLLCFCKNVSFVLVAFWFQIYCAFTAQYTYDYMYLLYFNMFFTMLPVLLLGMFDRQVSDQRILQKVPQLYADGIKQKYYNMKLFTVYSLIAIYQSLVCFFVPMLLLGNVIIASAGYPESKTMIGSVQGFATILAINLFTASHMENWNWIFISGMILTGVIFLSFVAVYLILPLSEMYRSWGDFFTVTFWATFLLTITLALLPTFLFPFVRGWIYPKKPTDIEIIREIERLQRLESEGIDVVESVSEAVKIKEGMEVSDVSDRELFYTGHRSLNSTISKPEKLINSITTAGGNRSRQRTLTASSNEFNPELPESFAVRQKDPIGDEYMGQLSPTSSLGLVESVTPEIRNPKSLKRSKSFKQNVLNLFNLKSGKMEKYHGFAFAQEEGAGRTVINGGNPNDNYNNTDNSIINLNEQAHQQEEERLNNQNNSIKNIEAPKKIFRK